MNHMVHHELHISGSKLRGNPLGRQNTITVLRSGLWQPLDEIWPSGDQIITSITQQPNTRATVIALHAHIIIFMFGVFTKGKTKTNL